MFGTNVLLGLFATPTSGTDPPGGTLGVGGHISADFQNNKEGGARGGGYVPQERGSNK